MTFISRSGLLADALVAHAGLTRDEAVNAADRVLMDPVQEGLVETFTILVESLAQAATERNGSSLAEKAADNADSVATLAHHEHPEARASVVHTVAALKRQAELA